MSKTHNKRRNAGLLYEFLVRTISKALVEGDSKKSSLAMKILKRHFKQGTELYREFRLINSLMQTTVSSEAVAASIVYEAKSAARSHNIDELNRQKSLLIKNINHALRDDTFYDQQVNEYKAYATIQTLLNDWRSQDPDLRRMAQYEDQLVKWLVTERTSPQQPTQDESPGTCRLLMKVMMKRMNEKYAGVLTTEQKQLIRAYAFSAANDNDDTIKSKLTEMRDELVSAIDEYRDYNKDNEYVAKKLDEARSQVVGENIETIDDDTVVRFMLYTKLLEELRDKEDVK